MQDSTSETVLACPAKMRILDLLKFEGRLDLEHLSEMDFIFKPSFKRHVEELVGDKLAEIFENDFLISTEKGIHLANDIDGGRQEYQKLLTQPS